ncbi:hypothetical protein MMC17_003170 [Xylographa soralifera]|nr:hypothetical protein [Xylographa soralifera]
MSSFVVILAIFQVFVNTAFAAQCNADNCLRALRGHSPQALTFCHDFLSIAPVTSTVTALPSYVSQYPESRISSACSCLSTSASISTSMPVTTSISTTLTSSTLTTSIISKSSTLSSSSSTRTTVNSSVVPKNSAISSITSSGSVVTSSLASQSSVSTSSANFKSTTFGSSTSTPTTNSSSNTSVSSKGAASSSSTGSSVSVLTSASAPTSTNLQTLTSTRSTASSSSPPSIMPTTMTGSTSTTSTMTSAASTSATADASFSVINPPTSCYQLPYPTGDLTAVLVNDTGIPDLPEYTAYFNSNNTFVDEIMITTNGTNVIYDLSDNSRIAFTVPGDYSIVINAAGISVYNADCTSELSITVPDFAAYINAISTSPSTPSNLPRSTLLPRDLDPFQINIDVSNQCGLPYDVAPSVTCGSLLCTLSSLGFGSGQYLGVCDYSNGDATCTDAVADALDIATSGYVGAITNLNAVIVATNRLITRGVLATGSAFLLSSVFTLGLVDVFLLAYGVFEAAVVVAHPDRIASAMCGAAYLYSYTDVTISYPGGSQLVASLHAAPTAPLSTAITVTDPSISTCANGCSGGGCNSYAACGGGGGGCFCGTDVHQVAVCFVNALCADVTPCASNADCGGGTCLSANCCGISACTGICPTGLPASRLARREEGGGNGTVLSMAGLVGGGEIFRMNGTRFS